MNRTLGYIWLFIWTLFGFFVFTRILYGEKTPEEAARSVYESFKQTISGSNTLQSSYINPLLHNIPLYTIDRSQSGNVQMLCPAEGEFLNLTLQPRSDGNVNVFIMYDSDNNGKLDKTMTIEGVSGFCSNGFFKCQQEGDYFRCRIYTFIFDPSDRTLKLQEVDQSKVGGCFCISPICKGNTSALYTNTGYILSVAGGAVAQAFMSVDPSYTVSFGSVESLTIRMYGQSKSSCVSAQGSSQVRELASLKDTPSRIPAEAQNLYLSQVTDPSSPAYYVDLISKNPLLADNSELKKCSLKYKVVTRKFDELFNFRGDCAFLYQSATYCGPNCIQVVTPIYQYPYTWSRADITFLLPYEYYKSLRKIEFVHCGRCHDLYFYLNGRKVYEFHGGRGEYWFSLDIPAINLIPPTKQKATTQVIQIDVYTKTKLGGHKQCEIYRDKDKTGPSFKFIFDEPVALCVVVDEFYDNTCTVYENNSDCVLWEEKQDGVYTVKNGQRTGIVPYNTCQEFCNRIICKVWDIERTYRCKKQSSLDFGVAQRRLESVMSSIDINVAAGRVSYKDYYLEGASNATMGIICRKDLNGNGIFESNEYALCIPASSGYLCPLDITRCNYRVDSFSCIPPGAYDSSLRKCVASSTTTVNKYEPACCEGRRYVFNDDGTISFIDPPCSFTFNKERDRCETSPNSTKKYVCDLNGISYPDNSTCVANCKQGNHTGTCTERIDYFCPEGTQFDPINITCYKDVSCGPDSYYDRNEDVCVTTITWCPSGYNLESGRCVSTPTCANGNFDPVIQACVSDLKCPLTGDNSCRVYNGAYYCSSPCISDYIFSGTWKLQEGNILFPPQSLPDTCEPVCRVRLPDVGKEVVAKMELNPNPRRLYEYRFCVEGKSGYVCPYDPQSGEEVEVQCTCHSFFAEATTALQAIRLAGSDFICSSGIEKSF